MTALVFDHYLYSLAWPLHEITYACTMLLEQIKGFYHGITKIFLLVGSFTMLSWHFLKMLI